MSVKVTLTIIHHICPENECLTDQELIDGTLEGVTDDTKSWLEAHTTDFHAVVERDDGQTLTIFETDEYNLTRDFV